MTLKDSTWSSNTILKNDNDIFHRWKKHQHQQWRYSSSSSSSAFFASRQVVDVSTKQGMVSNASGLATAVAIYVGQVRTTLGKSVLQKTNEIQQHNRTAKSPLWWMLSKALLRSGEYWKWTIALRMLSVVWGWDMIYAQCPESFCICIRKRITLRM